MSLKIFPQAVTLLPDVAQEFFAESRDLIPLWCNIAEGAGVVRPDAAVAQSIASGGSTQTTGFAESALELVAGFGAIEFTIEAGCLPVQTTGTGHFFINVYFAGASAPDEWSYTINIDPDSVGIGGDAPAASIVHNVAVGDVFRIELNNGFRLYINGVLRNEFVTGFTGGIQYPAWFEAQMQNPTGSPSPVIPAPRLTGDWRLREFDSDSDPVVAFLTPVEGTITQDGATVGYSDGDTPGAYKLAARINPGIKIWQEGGSGGGSLSTTGGTWNVGNFAPPPPISGTSAWYSPTAAGQKTYTSIGVTSHLQVDPGDVMTVYVFLDAVSPPSTVQIAWRTTDSTLFVHRAYWGANNLEFSPNGTPGHWHMGALPATGQWVRLEVPASVVDLEGRMIDGFSLEAFDGKATYDQLGKYPGQVQYAEALITIPALRILGDPVRTVQPSAQLRIQTNYDVGPGVTWSVVSGGGSFSNGVFTAPASPGTTVVRATSGDQIAQLTLNILAVITPNFPAAGPGEVINFDTNIPSGVTWSASAGSINSSTGEWQAPAVTDPDTPVRITATNGTFTATLDVFVLPLFPLNDPVLPVNRTRKRSALISMSEDRTSRIVREKAAPYDSYRVRYLQRDLEESNEVDDF